MAGELIYDWKLFFYPLMVVCYFQFIRYMDMRWSTSRQLTDDEFLARLAEAKGKSEYEVFFLAAESWRRPTGQVEADFKTYLLQGQLPYYVIDYIRRAKAELLKP